MSGKLGKFQTIVCSLSDAHFGSNGDTGEGSIGIGIGVLGGYVQSRAHSIERQEDINAGGTQ